MIILRASSRLLWAALPMAVSLSIGGCGGSSSSAVNTIHFGKFKQTNLVADKPGIAAVTDPNLVNPWAIASSATSPFWISNNGTGLATLYRTAGTVGPLVVTIPAKAPGGVGPVTGQVYNPTTSFVIPGSTAAAFIFSSEDGLISAWKSGTTAVVVSDQSASGAVYKGLAIASSGGADYLYATNFAANSVDVFDGTFALKKSFTDPVIPVGYAPFGIQAIDGLLYVTYAKQDTARKDDVPGTGNGFIDVFKPDGTLVKRLVARGVLDSPWGLAKAPTAFGGGGKAWAPPRMNA